MKKKLFYYLFAVLCTATLFTSCSDDDDNGKNGDDQTEVTDISGSYKGNLVVSIDGSAADPVSQVISIAKSGDQTSQVILSLKKFSFAGQLVGDIEVPCTVEEKDGVQSFSGQKDLKFTTEFGQTLGTLPTSVSGTVRDGKVSMKIGVTVAAFDQTVDVAFEGDKMSGNESGEAKILSFTFDASVESNAVVSSDPVINEENATITFEVKNASADDLKKLVPTVVVSAKATVTPDSETEIDFSSGSVVFTVVAENGSSREYTASISGRTSVVNYDFETWVSESHKPTLGTALAYDIPEGWRTSNPGIVEMKGMVGEKPWSVLKITDSDRNSSAAQIQTIDSDGKSIFGFKIPKVTAGSLFLGYWKTNAKNTLNSTKFGVEYNNSLGKPVSVKGWYKYESGKDYYTCEAPYMDNCPSAKKVDGAEYVDEYSIKVSLYTTDAFDNSGYTDCLTGEEGELNFYTSSRVVGKGGVEGGSTDGQWKEFTITLDYGDKEFDPNQKYRFAIVCSSSKDGDKFWGSPGSKLLVDDIEVIYKK